MWKSQLTSRMLVFTVLATLYIINTVSAHMAISNPPAQAGPWTQNPSSNVHAWIGYQGKKFPCGGYPRGPVTTYNAGDIIPVRFWNFNVKNYNTFPPPAGTPQARHGGGACEFSLSYDGGKTWRVIGQYTKTCPDLFYEWPVQIPANAPSCTDPDMCLFSFSWTAYATDQFYHHCANILISSNSTTGNLPLLNMTVVDVTQLHQNVSVHANGDKLATKSTGPDPNEVTMNTNGYFAYGGGAGTKGLNLGLVTGKNENPAPDPDDNTSGSGYSYGGTHSSGSAYILESWNAPLFLVASLLLAFF